MHSISLFKEILDHMNWADAKIWECILAIPAANSDERLKKVLHHYHITQYAFYHIWRDLPLEFPEISEFKNLRDMAVWASRYPALLKAYIAEITEQDLASVIRIPWSKRLEKITGKKVEESDLAQTLLQVALHSSHHRGQVSSRIRELKNEPPIVDFIAWIWLGKPSASWPVTEEKI